MKNALIISSLFAILTTSCSAPLQRVVVAEEPLTYCNPLDLSYRFMVDKQSSRREAADPTMVLHKGTYYLFASKTGGYWYSDDLLDWKLLLTDEIPTEEYAPTAISMRDTMFFMGSSRVPNNRIYKSADPKSGKWEVACDAIALGAWDPCLFQDDDGRLYFYWGCSNSNPMYGVEMDPITFEFIGEPKELVHSDYQNRGWEISSDYNTDKHLTPWIEGAWINKHNGKYYFQYAGPDARFKCYSDAVLVSDSPLGEYTLAPHNAFAYKPEGFACGAGHGSTFEDKYGNMWHVGTVSMSVKHPMERRLALYPTFFDENGVLYTHTRFGDYPTYAATKKINSPEEFETGWMLLSYNKPVEVSSTLEDFPASNMVNEDIRTYWSAASGDAGEWAIVDLEDVCQINALQVNFAEQDTEIYGRQEGISHKYIVEFSINKDEWQLAKDESESTTDNTNNYIEFASPAKARYIRVKNLDVPSGKFAISGIRAFGVGTGDAPQSVKGFTVTRDESDRRDVLLKWDTVKGATGYNISYGVGETMLYHNYMVYDTTELTIRSLDTQQPYYFTIEAFNENGVSEATKMAFTK